MDLGSIHGFHFSLHDGKVTMWEGSRPPGKVMSPTWSGIKRDIKEVFAAVRPDGIVCTRLFLTEKECLEESVRKLGPGVKVKKFPLSTAGGHIVHPFGKFSCNSVSIENGFVMFRDAILVVQVQDLPPGLHVDLVQLEGRTLLYIDKDNVIAEELIASS